MLGMIARQVSSPAVSVDPFHGPPVGFIAQTGSPADLTLVSEMENPLARRITTAKHAAPTPGSPEPNRFDHHRIQARDSDHITLVLALLRMRT
jgi:hypothetical protein